MPTDPFGIFGPNAEQVLQDAGAAGQRAVDFFQRSQQGDYSWLAEASPQDLEGFRREAQAFRSKQLRRSSLTGENPERVPTFQRSESPLARSYIDSFLMGNNPASVRSAAPNAAVQKASLQRQQNAAFGTPAERLLRQREVQAATPWAVTPPTRTVRSTVPENAAWTAQNGESAGVGINKNVSDALRDTGTDVGALQAKRDGRGGNLGAAMQVKETQNLIEQLMRTYEGDADRLAADIRGAGGVIPLAKKTRR